MASTGLSTVGVAVGTVREARPDVRGGPADGVQPGPWCTATDITAWCVTCGTDVAFHAPWGQTPVDLAADERACVWCGEALVLSFAVVDERPSGGAPGPHPGARVA